MIEDMTYATKSATSATDVASRDAEGSGWRERALERVRGEGREVVIGRGKEGGMTEKYDSQIGLYIYTHMTE